MVVSFALILVAVSVGVAFFLTARPTADDSCLSDRIEVADTTPSHWDVVVRAHPRCHVNMDVSRARYALLREDHILRSGYVSELAGGNISFINMVGPPTTVDSGDLFRIARTSARPGDGFWLMDFDNGSVTLPD